MESDSRYLLFAEWIEKMLEQRSAGFKILTISDDEMMARLDDEERRAVAGAIQQVRLHFVRAMELLRSESTKLCERSIGVLEQQEKMARYLRMFFESILERCLIRFTDTIEPGEMPQEMNDEHYLSLKDTGVAEVSQELVICLNDRLIKYLGADLRAVFLTATTFQCVELGYMIIAVVALLFILEERHDLAVRTLEEASSNAMTGRLSWVLLLLHYLGIISPYRNRCEQLARIFRNMKEEGRKSDDRWAHVFEEMCAVKDIGGLVEFDTLLGDQFSYQAKRSDEYPGREVKWEGAAKYPDRVFERCFRHVQEMRATGATRLPKLKAIAGIIKISLEGSSINCRSTEHGKEWAIEQREIRLKNTMLLFFVYLQMITLGGNELESGVQVEAKRVLMEIDRTLREDRTIAAGIHPSFKDFFRSCVKNDRLEEVGIESQWAGLSAVYEMHGRKDGLLAALFADTKAAVRSKSVPATGEMPESCREFHVLRRWSSLTPLSPVDKFYYENVGGCYALRIGNRYLIIDPGFDTLYALWKYSSIGLDDIQGIIVTHGHPDHDGGLRELLCCMGNAEASRETPPLDLWVPNEWCDIPEGDVHALLRSRMIRVCRFDRNVWPKNGPYQLEIGGTEVQVEIMPTSHVAASRRHMRAIGMSIKLTVGSLKIGITSDAAGKYDPLPLAGFLADCDMIVCHVGPLKVDEALESADAGGRDQQHLGLLGTTQLISEIERVGNRNERKPGLLVLSEFAALSGMIDWRTVFRALLKRNLELMNRFAADPIAIMIKEIGSSVLLADNRIYVSAGCTSSFTGYVPLKAVDWGCPNLVLDLLRRPLGQAQPVDGNTIGFVSSAMNA